MKLNSVSVKRLYIQIAEQLAEAISSGELAAGSRLPSERDLAARFDVSRPTIREALIALEVSELVEIRSGSGVYVAQQVNQGQRSLQTDEPGPFEILEARMLFESEAAALAAQRISPQELHALRGLLKTMSELRDGSVEQAESVDQQFHMVIAEASRNSAIATTVRWLWGLRNEAESSVVFHAILRRQGSRPIVEDHQQILDALQKHDSVAASKAMRSHLQRVIDQFSEYSLG